MDNRIYKQRGETAHEILEHELDVFNIKVFENISPSNEEILQMYAPYMWKDEVKRKINPVTFAEAFRDINHLIFHNGQFYDISGKVSRELVKMKVWESVKDLLNDDDISKKVENLVNTIECASLVEKVVMNDNIIPFKNGDYYIKEKEFHVGSFSPTPYRLKGALYFHKYYDIKNFKKWLNDLFNPEDIEVLQEYMAYCMIANTKVQKALFLVGEGGVGKSVLGVILEEILGSAMLSISDTKEFIKDKFKLPELEHKLVLYDDDLDSEALTNTGLYKKIITNNIAITADRKYGQAFSFVPSVKIVACCNEMLTSLYDNTDGFFRRLLPIRVKPKKDNFVPDPLFYDKIRQEIPGIIQWSLFGLSRLVDNNFVIKESQETIEYLNQKKKLGNHFPDFMEECFDFDITFEVCSAEIMSVYQTWCIQNSYEPRRPRSLQTWLADNNEKYKIKKSQNIYKGDKRVNGYFGMKIKPEWTTTFIIK